MTTPITGYAEGFYGRLLSWAERSRLLTTLQSLGMSTYYYAPKEDPWHRFDWRTPYPQQWLDEFQRFCLEARKRNVVIVAGVAPGLDFDFSHLPDGEDFRLLVSKCELLLGHGAQVISLLMDDIDTDYSLHAGVFTNEGEAHAALANVLGDALGNSLGNSLGNDLSNSSGNTISDTISKARGIWVTPRIYADELIADTPDYLPMFINTLKEHHTVLYCGSDVVSQTLDNQSQQALCINGDSTPRCNIPKHRVILWDNLYANDYCPRRLFVGAWRQREAIQHVLLNPTGMINTDCLLLALMADGLMRNSNNNVKSTIMSSWKQILVDHSVPEAFFHIAQYFDLPVFNNFASHDSFSGLPLDSTTDSTTDLTSDKAFDTASGSSANTALVRDAIEECLWRWKSPLSREWYAAIFGLKHDLLTQAGEHEALRIRKTQNAPLAQVLLDVDNYSAPAT